MVSHFWVISVYQIIKWRLLGWSVPLSGRLTYKSRKPTTMCTLLFKVMGFFLEMHIWLINHHYFEASFYPDIYQVFWDDNVKFHIDYSSRIGVHSKSVRCEKRDWELTGRVFGGYFNICDRLVWEFKSFLFHGIDMKLMHKITVCVFGSWNKIDPFITNYSKNRHF